MERRLYLADQFAMGTSTPIAQKSNTPIDKKVEENNTSNKYITPLTPQVGGEQIDLDADASVEAFASTVGRGEKSVSDEPQQLAEPQKKAANKVAVPYQEIVDVYNETLGDVLPKAQVLTEQNGIELIMKNWQKLNSKYLIPN